MGQEVILYGRLDQHLIVLGFKLQIGLGKSQSARGASHKPVFMGMGLPGSLLAIRTSLSTTK